MNNEPVAWMRQDDDGEWVEVMPGKGTPFFYTHPAQKPMLVLDGNRVYPAFKELTDEEIDELANKYLYVLNDVPYANDIKEFARAILRKAQDNG